MNLISLSVDKALSVLKEFVHNTLKSLLNNEEEKLDRPQVQHV